MADIEAARHLILDEQVTRQQTIADAAVDRFIVEIRKGRNWFRNLGDTIASLRDTRDGIAPQALIAANQAHISTEKANEIASRKGAVDLTESIGPYMGFPRNEAFIQRVSTRVADRSGALQDEVTTRAIEDNRGLGVLGQTYRDFLSNPAPFAILGLGLVASTGLGQGIFDGSGNVDVVAFGLRAAGEFLAAHGTFSAVKDELVQYHSRHARNLLGATTADLMRRISSWNEQRIVNGDNYQKSADEYEVNGQLADNIGQSVGQELTHRGASLPIVIDTTIGVPETVAGIVNASVENSFVHALEKMVEQRRARFIVVALALGSTLILSSLDLRNRPNGPLPTPTPIVITYTPTATPTATPSPTESPTPRATDTVTPTATPAFVVEYFLNPDNNYASPDKDVSGLLGYAWSLIADVDFNWEARYGHKFNASPEDMVKLEELRNKDLGYFEYRARRYAEEIRRLNNGRDIIHGDSIDHKASNVRDGIPGLIRPTDEDLRKLK